MCRAVRTRLSPPRYRHVLGVARTAEKLARRYGVPRAKARVAGVLHDIARQWTPEQLVAYAAEHELRPSATERIEPILLHARVAADIAAREFGVTDADTLAAIETHTVAVPGMSALQQILFIADTCEPSRRFEGRGALEAAALRSLDEGLFESVRASLAYLIQRNVPIAPETVEVYNQLVIRHGSTS